VKQKAAFFDRDGTLIKNVPYLSDLRDIELLPGIIDFCLQFQSQGYLLFVVTNQSGITRGFFSHDFVQETHHYLASLFADKGVIFSKFYYCPHHPSQNCFCRKPSPGMLELAAQEYNLDLTQSLLFGDKNSDIQAGSAAGCKAFYIQETLAVGVI